MKIRLEHEIYIKFNTSFLTVYRANNLLLHSFLFSREEKFEKTRKIFPGYATPSNFFAGSNSDDNTFLFRIKGSTFTISRWWEWKRREKCATVFWVSATSRGQMIAVGFRVTRRRESFRFSKKSSSLRPSLSASSHRACHAQIDLVRNLRFLCPRSPVEIRSRDIAGATLGTYPDSWLRQESPRKRRCTSGAINLWHLHEFAVSIVLYHARIATKY